MKNVSRFLITGAICISVYGCCNRFSDLTSGTKYIVGDLINASCSDILVEKFQWSNSNWTTEGSARIDNHGYAGGSGNDINANNVNLNFRFKYPVKSVTLKFGELGGNVNVVINETLKNTPDFMDLNGMTVDGVLINVNATKQGANWYGEIVLTGEITGFKIGGQELWLDDICYKK